MRHALAVVVVTLFGSMALAQTTQPTKSADGIAFPVSSVRRPFHVVVPFVNDRMGGTAGEFSSRVFSVEHSAALLKRKWDGQPDFAWFVLGFGGTSVIGIDLTDGRVSRAVLICDNGISIRDRMDKATVRHDPESANDPEIYWFKLAQDVVPFWYTYDSRISILQVEPGYFYIHTHDLPADQIKAMNDKSLVVGMRYEAAVACLGKADQTLSPEGEGDCLWTLYKFRPVHAQFGLSSGDYMASMQAAAAQTKADRIEPDRTISARFENGKVTQANVNVYK